MNKLIGRISRSIRYRLGFRVANPALEPDFRDPSDHPPVKVCLAVFPAVAQWSFLRI